MDLSHGHPPSLSSHLDRRSQQTSHAGSAPNTPSPLSSHSYDPPFSLQNRRLHLRNVGFRATKVSSHRLGVRSLEKISRLFNAGDIPQSEPAPLPTHQDPSPQNRSANNTRSDYRPSTTLGILQEISNSTRNRYSQKRPIIPIEEDNPERPLLDISPAVATPGSWYRDAPNTQQSPLTFHSTDAEFDTMRLREISGNERRSPPPLSSPLARQVRGRKKRGLDLRKTTFGASEYIEHIENELQQVKEAMHSPSTGKPLQDKLRILQAENKQLKGSIFHLEEAFDERVKQAVEHKAAVELDLRRKIKSLEDEVVLKEDIITNLQQDRDEAKYDGNSIDALRAMIERLEQDKDRLEEANRVVEKRNEALTGLLAQSPTRSHHCFELASPIRPDPRRTPRPKSMVIPKLSSSPQTEDYRRPQSVLISPTQSCTGYFSPKTALNLEDHQSSSDAEETDVRKIGDSESLDSGLGEPCAARSPVRGGSRRSSIASHASASPAAWGVPLPWSPSNDKATVKQSKHRRTRRFESGSTQLKPLLLPTMAAEGNPFQTNYTPTLYSSPTRREFSEQSLDPTIAFLSESFQTPNQCPALPSNCSSETALKALEGSSPPHFESFEDIIAQNDSHLAVLDLSPVQYEMPDQIQEVDLQESDSPSCVDDTIVEGEVTALPHHQEPRAAAAAEPFSSLVGEMSLTASNPERRSGLKDLCTSFESVPEVQQSTLIDLYSDYTSLRQISAVSSQELMPGPLFLPSASYRTADASRWLARGSSPIVASCNVDDSPIPRKRQRSCDPDSCSFVMPTLCTNSTHDGTGHEKRLPDARASPSNASIDISPEPQSKKPPSRPRSPLERLHKATASPAALTSVTLRTIFGTLSRYTSYVQEIRRDPTALARRVLANAWHNNWKRLGKLSWWVLGLFLGPGAKAERSGKAHGMAWNWDQCDGEAIAEQVCGEEVVIMQHERVTSSQEPLQGPSEARTVRFEEADPGYRTEGTRSKAKLALKQGARNPKKDKTSWGKSLYLWGKFSVAILLAVSGAVISGPGEMLRDCAERGPGKTASMTHEQMAVEQERGEVPGEQPATAKGDGTPVIGTSEPAPAKKGPVKEANISSEVRNASGESARSLSGAGAGPTLGVVKPGRSSPKTPSPARRRRRGLALDTKTGKTRIFGSLAVDEGGDRFEDNSRRKEVESRTSDENQNGPNILGAQPDHNHEGACRLQWVRNLNIRDFKEIDDHDEPTQFYSESGKRTHLSLS